MSKIKYKVNGEWREIEISEDYIEAVEFESSNPPPLKINVYDDIKAETKMI